MILFYNWFLNELVDTHTPLLVEICGSKVFDLKFFSQIITIPLSCGPASRPRSGKSKTKVETEKNFNDDFRCSRNYQSFEF